MYTGLDQVPQEMRNTTRWVLWQRRGSKKVPCDNTGKPIDATNPQNWLDFEEAAKYAKNFGLGFALGDGWLGIDLDDCLNSSGELQQWSAGLLRTLPFTYTEVSPSGRGVKLFYRYSGKPLKCKGAGIEVYTQRRFFTVTGHKLPTASAIVAELPETTAQQFVDSVHLIEIARQIEVGEFGEKLQQLFLGKRLDFPSDSEADQSFANLLVSQCKLADFQEILFIVRLSGRWREKWLEVHSADGSTYAEMTVNKALIQPTPQVDELAMTDLGNARRLVKYANGTLKYVKAWGWLYFDGKIWRKDDVGKVYQLAKETVRQIYKEAAACDDESERKKLAKWALQSESAHRIRSMVELATSEPEIAVPPHEFDNNPYLLACQNGVLDLRTMTLVPHGPQHMLTKICFVNYNPQAQAPTWLNFLDCIFEGNVELIKWLQKFFGYCLTGDTSEQVVVLFVGSGANGKSTLIETLRDILGGYMKQSPFHTFINERYSVSNDLAMLAGARLVVATEGPKGAKLNASLVKSLSGGDTVTARFLYKEFFQFTPTFKVILVTNHKPLANAEDFALWRRIKLVPFNVTIPPEKQDRRLKEKLLAEKDGIFAWLVEGYKKWAQDGLGLCTTVECATAAYRSESDILQLFLDTHCVLNPMARTSAGALYEAYVDFCREQGETPLALRSFSSVLETRGFAKTHTRSGKV